jgi:phenylalanyl-tRNA synthetase beta chain
MRIPFQWIGELVKLDVSPEELCRHLIMLGFADAEVVPNEWDMLDSFVVGRASAVSPHPTDPHLKLVKVNVGYADLDSVCGAPVIEEGKLYAVALPGARLGTGRTVDAAPVSGVVSRCVLCSGKEAWLDESKDELLEVEDDNAPGVALVEALGLQDPVIEVEVTPNRGDCLGLIGIARELAAFFGKELLIPEPGLKENGGRIESLAKVEIADPEGCPRYGALVCEDVVVRGSPARSRARLRLAGVRAINNVVDATNLILFETGHPLHAFDLDKLAGRKIIVRRAKNGERIVGIDGNDYALKDQDLVIADADRPVAIAGVIGGSNSEVTAGTRRILIEGAYFDHCSVWKTSRRLGLSTEASYRFERGVDIGAVLYVLARAGSLVQTETRCKVARGMIDVYPNPAPPRRLVVSPKKVNRLLGTSIPEQEICDYLERLGFMVSPGKELEVLVPTRRGDVECEADIAEDVARHYGYERIGEKTALASQAYARMPEEMRRIRETKQVLRGLGLYEVVTDSMIGPDDLGILGLAATGAIAIVNPMGVQASCLRPSLIPGLVKALVDNEFKGQESVALFEMGNVYLREGGAPVEPFRMGVGLSGLRQGRSWHARACDVDLFDVKGIVESVSEALGMGIEAKDSDHPAFHPGRRLCLVATGAGGDCVLGHAGEILPSICEALGSKRRLYAAEIELRPLLGGREVTRYKEIPKYPGVKRDIAVVVAESVKERELRSAILAEAGEIVESLEVFDLYRGEQIPEGTKSLAYGIVFRSESRTLKEEEVDGIMKRIDTKLSSEFAAKIRAG